MHNYQNRPGFPEHYCRLTRHIQQTYNLIMIRTQIYIPEEIHQATKLLAKKQGRTLAELIRSFIAVGIIEEKKKVKTPSLDRLIKLGVKGGPKDLSRNFDKYLVESIYGKNR